LLVFAGTAGFFSSTFFVSGALAVVGFTTFFVSVALTGAVVPFVALASLPVGLTSGFLLSLPLVSATLVSSYFSCLVLNLVTNL